jgi:hypothetical protein
MDALVRRVDTGVMWHRGKPAVIPVDSNDVVDGRERWAQARRLYESNPQLFEDEADARSALGLDHPAER